MIDSPIIPPQDRRRLSQVSAKGCCLLTTIGRSAACVVAVIYFSGVRKLFKEYLSVIILTSSRCPQAGIENKGKQVSDEVKANIDTGKNNGDALNESKVPISNSIH